MNKKIEYKEHKSFTIEDFQECKEVDDPNYFYFSGYASVFGNVDLGNDIIVKGAFEKTLKKFNNKKKLPLLWQHEMHKPIGVAEIFREDERGLYIKGKLPKKGFVLNEVLPQIEVGSVREMSIGFFTKDQEYQKDIRIIKEIDLYEASLVTIAMNPEAQVESFKSINNLENLSDIEYILKNKGFSNTEAKTLISKVKEFSQRDVENEKQRDVAIQTNNQIQEILDLIKSINIK